jgi:hypothetical protein
MSVVGRRGWWAVVVTALFTLMSIPAQAQFPPDVYLSQTPADVTVYGAAQNDKTGFDLVSGDFNGDESRDLVILSPGSAAYGSAFFHILWGPGPLDSVIDLATYQDPISKVSAPIGEAGIPCSITFGDFNGDGLDDIALGIVFRYPEVNTDGKVYIILGALSFPDAIDLANPNSNVAGVYPVPGSAGWLGESMASGDINGDGYDDLVLSAPAYDPGGRVYIIYGRETFPESIHLATVQGRITRIIDPYSWQATGEGLACKDINHDGFDDLLIGSPGEAEGYEQGIVSVLFGSPAMPSVIYLYDNAPGIKKFWGEYPHGQLGWRVAIGDLNKDGTEELILAAQMADPLGCQDCGELYVVSWDENLPDSIYVGATTVPIKRLLGAGIEQCYGERVTCADVTGDGYDDLLIRSNRDLANPSDVSKVTVVYGSTNLPDTISLATDSLVTRFYAEKRADDFGRGLGTGDVNGDGITDIFVGANAASPSGRIEAGKAYVFFGMPTLTAVQSIPAPKVQLLQNYPNPFGTSTTIEYKLDTISPVRFAIYDVLGRRVTKMEFPPQSGGRHWVTWDGLDARGHKVGSGIYFYRLTAGDKAVTKKMVLLR